MSDHLTQNQIEDYGRQRLAGAELLAVSDHLDACESCCQQVEKTLDGDVTIFSLKSEVFGEGAEMHFSSAERTHLMIEQIARYIDGTLAGEELQTAKDHLTSCEQCGMAVDDLRAFRTEVATGLDREYRPARARVATGDRWSRFGITLPPFLRRSPLLVFGSALAALLLISYGLFIWQAMRRNEMNPVVGKNGSSPTATLPAAVPTAPPDTMQPLPPPPPMILARLNDGEGQVTLDQEGNLSGVDDLPSAYQQMIKSALADRRFEKSPLLAGLNRRGSPLMSGGDDDGNKFSVISPVGKVLLSNRPVFRWKPMAGATGYVVEVYDEKFNPVATSPQLSKTSWTATQPLKRGGFYSWQVKAIKNEQEFTSPHPPAPQAKFRILDQTRANELMRAQRAYASSHLTLGGLYMQAGLLDEAERELRALQRANPDSEITRQLLANLRSMRRY